MNIIRKLVVRNLLPSFLISFAVAALFAIPNSAHASYAWVMGSYKMISSANSMILRPGFAEVGAVIVRTRAANYKRRIIAGCFATKEDAMAQRPKFVSVRHNNGIWLTKTNLGCRYAPPTKVVITTPPGNSSMRSPVPAAISQPILVVSGNKQFKPKRWRFKSGDKIAYTNGTHPSLFFQPSPDSDGSCFLITSMYVTDLESIVPPQEESQYFFRNSGSSKICKAAYIYKVSK